MIDLSSWVNPLIYVAITLVLTAVVAWLVGLGIRALFSRDNPQLTLAAQRAGVVIVWAVGVILAVQGLGVSVTVLLVVIALLGVAALLALRQPLENFGARYFADVYTPFKIGDTIRVDGATGKVIETNAMTTLLLTEENHLLALPNLRFLSASVENLTPQAWKEISIPVSVPSSADLPRFESEVLKGLAKLRLRLDARFPPIFSTRARSASSTDLLLTVMVRRPEDREALQAEIHRRIAEALARQGRSPTPPST